jgi:hypothetical protein
MTWEAMVAVAVGISVILGLIITVIKLLKGSSDKSAADAVTKESIGAKEHIDKEIKALKSETMADQKDDRIELRRSIEQLRTELKADIAQLRQELIAGLASNAGGLSQVDQRLAALNANFIQMLRNGK